MSDNFDLNETFTFGSKLKSSSDEFLKEALLVAVKETLGKMEGLPKVIEKKIKNEQFLKEKIEEVVESRSNENGDNNRNSRNNRMADQKISNFRYSPYGGEAHIKNWDDLYHYLPQIGTKIRIWKLEFKESAMKNAKKFKGCANPADLVDWLVPDIDDIKRATKDKKRS